MFIELLMKLADKSPRFRRFLWQRWYQYLAGYRVSDWHFMNYGYEPESEEPFALDLQAADEADRYSIQLYHRVASAGELAGKEVLEVGCGRGGGSSFLKRYHHPREMTGVDFSAKAIRFCQAQHRVEGLKFLKGDAEQLPFSDETFDAILNVESSHCYGSMPAFVAEVKRALRPGGLFLFADFRTPADADNLDQVLQESGLQVLEREIITLQVLEALRLDSERKLQRLEESAPKRLLGTLRRFAAIEGSDLYEFFENGTFVYLRYALRK